MDRHVSSDVDMRPKGSAVQTAAQSHQQRNTPSPGSSSSGLVRPQQQQHRPYQQQQQHYKERHGYGGGRGSRRRTAGYGAGRRGAGSAGARFHHPQQQQQLRAAGRTVEARHGRQTMQVGVPPPVPPPPPRVDSPSTIPDFPNCADDCLRRVDAATSSWTGRPLKTQELQTALDNELFCLSTDRRSCRLDDVQRLQLLDLLCVYFKGLSESSEKQRYGRFETIFLGREGETQLHEARVACLESLCSLAVQYPCYGLLEDTAQWLFKVGVLAKPYAQQIVAKLTSDFCCSAPQTVTLIEPLQANLHKLAEMSPNLALICLVLSWVSRSAAADGGGVQLANLVDVTAYWLCSASDKLTKALKDQERTNSGVALITAICNEVHHFPREKAFPLMAKLDCHPTWRPNRTAESDQLDISSGSTVRLHNGLLHFMLAVKEAAFDNCLSLLAERDMANIANLLDSDSAQNAEELTALDRFAQLLQVAVACNCFGGSITKLRRCYEERNFGHHDLLDYVFASAD